MSTPGKWMEVAVRAKKKSALNVKCAAKEESHQDFWTDYD